MEAFLKSNLETRNSSGFYCVLPCRNLLIFIAYMKKVLQDIRHMLTNN